MTASHALLRMSRFLNSGETSQDLRAVHLEGGREADSFYRELYSHDKVVSSTHGVNCTGSCRWKIYVKDGVITWESQDTDYPSVGADRPEYEPRGCPRGASFSWYSYSPTRVRYPYARGVLVDAYREARRAHADPVAAWASIVDDPAKRRAYQQARGRGGLVRVDWDEAVEIVAAAHVHTLKRHGPDRIAGFSPIPAMSMVSHAVGSRFMSLIGAPMLSFYDWYADLPVASPQVFGDQTDVPESADWWDAAYLVMWGSNVPVTRTPDAHWMTEARYRGQKVVVVSPDYADNTKFADEWLAPHPGTDGALASAMGHVVLKEFFVDSEAPFFTDYVRRYTDLPFLISLERKDGSFVPGKFLTAADLGDDSEKAEWKTVLFNEATGEPFVPNGSVGHRWSSSDEGSWNLDLGDVVPTLTLHSGGCETAEVSLPRFDAADGSGAVLRRGVPVRRIGDRLVTTVFDLLLAQYGVHRPGLPGEDWPTGYEDAEQPCTPAWQEQITSVPAERVTRIAREFADTAIRSRGRCMILMGAGTNHWFHSDQVYRSFLTLLLLTGCQGRNGGGWAHYVGQEKVRPLTGWQTLASGTDWHRPPRQMIGTAYWYLHTDQWRYDGYSMDALSWPLAKGKLDGATAADCLADAARMGWMPSYPTFDRNPLDLAEEAEELGKDPVQHVVDELQTKRLGFACQDPDAPENWPRVLTVWRANLLGSSGKGNEYFLRHLLGAADTNLRTSANDPAVRPKSVKWRDEAPEGKLDLLLSLDFRMTSTTLFSDIVLPAATWYEKHDLSSTDMHPFVHAFTAAVDPPWQTRTDFEAFHSIARRFSELAKTHLGVRKDIVATALQHDSPGEVAQPGGVARDWSKGDEDAVPGRTMPTLTVVERDYTAVADKLASLGPVLDEQGVTIKGSVVGVAPELHWLAEKNGVSTQDRPLLDTDAKAAEAILALSGTTNGALALRAFQVLEKRVGRPLAQLAHENESKRITFADTKSRPTHVVTSPEWSGSESGGRRYSPFTINVELLKPWHTLTGRQHFYLDHDWQHELGEALPVYRAPLDMQRLFGEPRIGPNGEREVTVRYLTPHSKWSIHSEYQDNLIMLTLSRGGPTFWMSPADAAAIGVADNDWVEAVNRNGVVVARAIVSHRMPEGTVFMYHAQDRTVNVPRSETTGKRGGMHNSLTRVQMKPTHLIGGYAQLTFALNYLGPTGNQRDEVTVIRRRSQEVEY
ncbi:nitrate reductase subunit alpha [Allokutzneria sp. NRRL B-24872]|uniref:nitrate reductase subunit alpha n=1 Tax=Allokutzneria sp. NRRL B-24872 TaxID=1137961 RepID=UPI000A36F919|nr:nitrate reductase subunit alpha [Allokutzneria sp. NRRL B-24872]